MSSLVATVCEAIAAGRRLRVFHSRGAPLLTKVMLLKTRWGSLYLHRFHMSDQDPELHNHPWGWAASVVLDGGYTEHVLDGIRVRRVRRRPGSVNLMSDMTFHRVDLLDEEAGAWTLFACGPKVQEWGFLDPENGDFTPWREFVTARGESPLE